MISGFGARGGRSLLMICIGSELDWRFIVEFWFTLFGLGVGPAGWRF